MSEDMNMRTLLAVLVTSLMHAACNSSPRLNAAEDPQRYVGGALSLSAGEHPETQTRSLGTGPLFVTDVIIWGGMGELVPSRDASCKDKEAEDPGNLFEWAFPVDERSEDLSHHGMRLLVPEGKTLCFKVLSRATRLVWAGFRPHPASK